MTSPKENQLFSFKFADKIVATNRRLAPFIRPVYIHYGTEHHGYYFIDGQKEQENLPWALRHEPINNVQYFKDLREERKDKKRDAKLTKQLEKGWRKDHNGTWIGEVEFLRRYTCCWWCGRPATFKDLTSTIIDESHIICFTCNAQNLLTEGVN